MKLMLNMASQRYLNQRLVTFIFLLLVIALSVVLVWQINMGLNSRAQIQHYQSEVAALEEQLQGSLPKRMSAEELTTQQQRYQQAIQLWQRDAFRWTELFERLETLLPDGVSIRGLQPDYNKNSLKLTGEARGLSQLQELLDRFHQASFAHVFLDQEQVIEVDDGRGGKRPAIGFSLSLEGVF